MLKSPYPYPREPKHLVFFGGGYVDQFDSYHYTGDYQIYVTNEVFGLKHKYYVNLSKGYKRNVWHLTIHVALLCDNSRDIEVFRQKYRTKKAAVADIFPAIEKFEETGDEIFSKYIKERIIPIFSLKSGVLEFIGDGFGSLSQTIQIMQGSEHHRKRYSYFIQKYFRLERIQYLTIGLSWKDSLPSISEATVWGSGYSAGSYFGKNKEEILEKMITFAKEKKYPIVEKFGTVELSN